MVMPKYIVKVTLPNGIVKYVKSYDAYGKVVLTKYRKSAKLVTNEFLAQDLIDRVVAQYVDSMGNVPYCEAMTVATKASSPTQSIKVSNPRAKAEALIKKEDAQVIDNVYRIVLAQHTERDAMAILEEYYDFSSQQNKEIAELVGGKWAFEGEYDCTLDYWTNIHNLIKSIAEDM